MLCALIMAGGKGTRFWPLSTEKKPKQFLNLIDKDTMLQLTVNRIKSIIPIERIFVCTVEKYVDLVKEQLPEISSKNIIIEPEGRNTAPCIALSAFIMKKYYNNANMIVLPSDHIIQDEEEFRKIILDADKFVQKNNNAIITLGIQPTRAETGYGYIKCGVSVEKANNYKILEVDSFVEKPNDKKAKEYLKDGNYLWNGGMFIWNIDNILNLIEKYSSKTFKVLEKLNNVKEVDRQNFINSNYKNTEAISIDYAILEKYNDIYVIPSCFGWDDVGSWKSLERHFDKDKYGNVFVARGIAYKSIDNIILTSKPIVINGVKDIIVVETDDYIMVSAKDSEQQLKDAKIKLDSSNYIIN